MSLWTRGADSPTISGAILDDKEGAVQVSADADGARHKQFYWSSTNVLMTRFLLKDGIVELKDFMPLPGRGYFRGLADGFWTVWSLSSRRLSSATSAANFSWSFSAVICAISSWTRFLLASSMKSYLSSILRSLVSPRPARCRTAILRTCATCSRNAALSFERTSAEFVLSTSNA
jgi:hypothetical protein